MESVSRAAVSTGGGEKIGCFQYKTIEESELGNIGDVHMTLTMTSELQRDAAMVSQTTRTGVSAPFSSPYVNFRQFHTTSVKERENHNNQFHVWSPHLNRPTEADPSINEHHHAPISSAPSLN